MVNVTRKRKKESKKRNTIYTQLANRTQTAFNNDFDKKNKNKINK